MAAMAWPGLPPILFAPAAAAGFLRYVLFALDPRIAIAIALLVASGACSLYTLGLDARVRDSSPPELLRA